ncbi:HIG1 domain family member 2A, mitochondrial-like [Hydractinia symbiolongicarpus]|uniref:HIG1 domain family member 2A, mitochondrial-like n=1 Tax=Hydractinia symbiolongicarpus TaxID=13093 RepID=UPI00254DC0B8|nr:HIG1 domain family member 2A, mitochondrial-like [Hydractinia symbiolongicarpus]
MADNAAVASKQYDELDFSFMPENPETHSQKLVRKIKENPFVPVGMGLTVTALVLGIANFQRGNQRNQQLMMRARVVAQGGTVMALVVGLYLAATKDKKK